MPAAWAFVFDNPHTGTLSRFDLTQMSENTPFFTK